MRPAGERFRRAGLTGAACLVLALGLPSLASAQISPGPLARAHGELEGSLQCKSCHAGRAKEAMSAQCLGCHKDLAWLVQRNRGFHARAARQACASCHPDHAGVDFALVTWPDGDPARFDHTRTGWPLQGSHRTVKCADCHKPAFRVSPAAAQFRRRSAGAGWLGLEPGCTSCHEDVHRGALDQTCVSCHSVEKWKPAPKFDHARTDYPLTGKHADVDCAKCHLDPRLPLKRTSAGEPVPVYRPLAHAECAACHADPHRGSLGSTCATCHRTTGFTAVARTAFDHDRTRYPLRGRHAAVSCAKCHDFKTPQGKRPPFASCTACHSDAHAGTATVAGRPTDCATCHTVDGFRPSTFTVAQHGQAKYALEGRHRLVACGACHVRVRTGAAAARVGTAAVQLRPAFARCRDCHADDHGTQLASRRDQGECSACHVVDGWTPSSFDARAHAALRLPLDGRHAEISCRACHGTDRRDLPPLARTASLGKAGLLFRIAEVECAACHVDPHQGRFAAGGARPAAGGCSSCHDARRFQPAAMDPAAHQRTAFPLEGAHRAVPCAACHPSGPRAAPASSLLLSGARIPVVSFTLAKQDCAGCHQNPHGDQFAARGGHGACESCHGVESFRPASRFDHDRDASFRLQGAHARVPCASCHTPRSGTGPRFVYRPLSRKCESCHANGRS